MRVVVGIDPTPGSVEALRVAVREAEAHGGEVLAVHAWQTPFRYVDSTPTTEALRAAARRRAERLLDEVLSQARADERVRPLALEGEPADVLLSLARSDDRLVVGSRRDGPLRQALRGSVTARVVKEARGPVVVVPAPRESA